MPKTPCPCSSGALYADCCKPFVAGLREPPDALTLMRSRYAAFATGAVDHLWRTLDPSHEDRLRDEPLVRRELSRACRLSRWRGLTIIETTPPDADGIAAVTFLARVFQSGRDMSFVERSLFRHDGTGWRYWKGELRPVGELLPR